MTPSLTADESEVVDENHRIVVHNLGRELSLRYDPVGREWSRLQLGEFDDLPGVGEACTECEQQRGVAFLGLAGAE